MTQPDFDKLKKVVNEAGGFPPDPRVPSPGAPVPLSAEQIEAIKAGGPGWCSEVLFDQLCDEVLALRAQLAEARATSAAAQQDADEVIERALWAMREPMTLDDARKGRDVLTHYNVERKKRAARAARSVAAPTTENGT